MDEVQHILDLFETEKAKYPQFVMFFTLAIFTGLRRGELLGLEWKDFDWDNHLMDVRRNSLWTKEKGIYTDTPKTKYPDAENPCGVGASAFGIQAVAG